MIQSLLNKMLGCSHQRTTFPQTPSRKNGAQAPGSMRNETYIVCLDCGKEFTYNWSEMRMGQPVTTAVAAPAAHVAA